jgi:hypothetical protein
VAIAQWYYALGSNDFAQVLSGHHMIWYAFVAPDESSGKA